MYFSIFIAILMGLISPTQPHTGKDKGTDYQHTTARGGFLPGDDTGGENGHVPPPRP